MSLAALTAAGAFVDPAPIETTVTWKGETYRVWIVRQSAYDLTRAVRELKDAQGGEVDQDAMKAMMISVYLRFGDDLERMSLELAKRLDPELQTALEQCINEVPEVPKASRPKKKSGTS